MDKTTGLEIVEVWDEAWEIAEIERRGGVEAAAERYKNRSAEEKRLDEERDKAMLAYNKKWLEFYLEGKKDRDEDDNG